MKDLSLTELGSLLLSASSSMVVANHAITNSLGEAILERTKEKIGEYQPESHGFNAWAPLAESTMDQRQAAGYTANNPLLRNGELRDSYTMRSDGNGAIIGSTSDIALYQEVGTPVIPPRPALGPAAAEIMDTAPELIGKVITETLRR